MKNINLIIETINYLIEKQDAVFITSDKKNRNKILILFRGKDWRWAFVDFQSEENGIDTWAYIGIFEIYFGKAINKPFAPIIWSSYNKIEHLQEILVEPEFPVFWEGISYDGMKKGGFTPINLGKTAQIKEPIDEKTLLHLLSYLSIEY